MTEYIFGSLEYAYTFSTDLNIDETYSHILCELCESADVCVCAADGVPLPYTAIN